MKYNIKYGTLQDNQLIYAPNKLVIENEQVFNGSAADYLAQGYYPIITTEPPQENEQFYYVEYYVIENGAINQRWEAVEIPVDNSATEQDYLQALALLGVYE